MATRGIRVLFVLPLLTALFIAGASLLATQEGFGQLITVQPDQVVLQFLRQVYTGNAQLASTMLSPAAGDIDLTLLGQHLNQQYGSPVTITAEVSKLTPESAVVWTDTRTTFGQRYFIDWTVERRGNRWVICDVGSLRDLITDVWDVK